jgi:hypothetical protein
MSYINNIIEKNRKKGFYWVGMILLPIGITLVGLGIGLGVDLLLKKCGYHFPIVGLGIGLGIGLIIDGIIFLKTYRYLSANKKYEL